jgi:peptidoglycan/xylan/chitin deacetylase (PgdA/CDA1 family)
MDYPHHYIENACQYLKLKWDPNNSSPGTIVFVIMFHSILKAGDTPPANGIMAGEFRHMMKTLHEQNFEAITMEQLVSFLEINAKIPERSVVLLVDDRHFRQYFDNYFHSYYEDYGWPIVNAWISHPEQTRAGLWEENEALAAEGWVDHQAHGVIHYPIVDSTDDEYIMGELQGSIDFIQEHFNKTPIAFIWPGGNFTQRGIQLARQVGYRAGFTVNPRGPIMFNWVPLADQADPMRPSYLAEGQMNDPLMVLPRYWPSQVLSEIDTIRTIGKEAAAYAEQNKAVELEYYDIVCAPALGPIPNLSP